MIVWGGYNGTYLNDGGRYNNSARHLLLGLAAVTPRQMCAHGHCTPPVFTWQRMLIWVGGGGGLTTCSYWGDRQRATNPPSSNAWFGRCPPPTRHAAELPINNRRVDRKEMITLGGANGQSKDGAASSPPPGLWTPVNHHLPLPPRNRQSAVWTAATVDLGRLQKRSGVFTTPGPTPPKSHYLYQKP